MNVVLWIVAGAIVGWIASSILITDGQHGILVDIAVGIVGSSLAGFFLSTVFNITPINQNNFNIPAILISLSGAIILLLMVRLFNTRGRSHTA